MFGNGVTYDKFKDFLNSRTLTVTHIDKEKGVIYFMIANSKDEKHSKEKDFFDAVCTKGYYVTNPSKLEPLFQKAGDFDKHMIEGLYNELTEFAMVRNYGGGRLSVLNNLGTYKFPNYMSPVYTIYREVFITWNSETSQYRIDTYIRACKPSTIEIEKLYEDGIETFYFVNLQSAVNKIKELYNMPVNMRELRMLDE